MPDVNSTLFAGSNSDGRAGDPVQSPNTSRVVIVGTRTTQTATDTKNYSRSLEAYTLYFFRITCGIYQATGNFRTRSIPDGSAWGETLPNDGAGNYLWPTAGSTRGSTFTDPFTGALVSQLTLSGDITGVTRTAMGSNGIGQYCHPTSITASDGSTGWYHCEVNSETTPELFMIQPASGASRLLGEMTTNFVDPGWNASNQCGGSRGLNHPFDQTDPNTWYCDVIGNDSALGATSGHVLVKAVYAGHAAGSGNDADLTGVGLTTPHTTYSPLWGHLAGCNGSPATGDCPFRRDLQTLLGEFDAGFAAVSADYSCCFSEDWAKGKFFFSLTLGGQDHAGYVAVFDPAHAGGSAGCIDNPATVGTTFSGQLGCIVADTPTLNAAAGSVFRYSALHTMQATQASSWLGVVLNSLSRAALFYRVTVTNVGGLPASGSSCTTTQPVGNIIPDWPDATYGPGCSTITVSAQPTINTVTTGYPTTITAQPGDFMTINSGNPLGTESIRLLYPGSDGLTWYVQRQYGTTFPNGGLGAATYNSVAQNGTLDMVTYGAYRYVWWDYVNGATATSITTTLPEVLAETHASYVDNGLQRLTFAATNGGMTGYEPARLSPPGGYPTLPVSIPGFGRTNFGDIAGIEVESHPSLSLQDPDTQADGRYFVDGAPFWGPHYAPYHPMNGATVSLVTGQLYKITGTAVQANYKNWPYFANSGTRAMREVGGPGSAVQMDGTATYQFQWCVALAAGECHAGSLLGDIYFNAPSVLDLQCDDNWGNLEGGNNPGNVRADVCVNYGSALINSIRTQAVNDSTGGTDRVISDGLGWPDNWSTFYNARFTPEGSWVWSDLPGDNQVHLFRVPPDQPDSVNRQAYVPVTVTVPTVATATDAIVEFGYAENGNPATSLNCMPRNEPCVAQAATIQATPFSFETLDAPAGLACSSGCTITVPGISGRVLYYRWIARNGTTPVQTESIQAVPVDPPLPPSGSPAVAPGNSARPGNMIAALDASAASATSTRAPQPSEATSRAPAPLPVQAGPLPTRP